MNDADIKREAERIARLFDVVAFERLCATEIIALCIRVRDEECQRISEKIEDRAKSCEANAVKYPDYAAEWYGIASHIRQLGDAIRNKE